MKVANISDRSGRWQPQPYMKRPVWFMWVTEVISGTGFYAVTERSRKKAAEVRATLAAELGDAPIMAEQVVPRMICALNVSGTWERVMVNSRCTISGCMLRSEDEQQQSPKEYWHVTLMEVGSKMCVSLSQLALVTRAIALERCSTRLYFLRRILLIEENSVQAKAYLRSLILNNQMITAQVFFSQYAGKTHVEVIMGNAFLSDTLVEAGFAKYNRFNDHLQRKKVSQAASCCSSEDIVSLSSKDSCLFHASAPASSSRNKKPVEVNNTLLDIIERINHVMKHREEIDHLTSSGSTLNLAIKSHNKRVSQHGHCEHEHASLNKYLILLRRLREENPHIHEIRDVKESHYKQLVEMFERWKVKYRTAKKKSDAIIDVIANIFISFTNKKFGFLDCKYKCGKLISSLNNELLLQNEGLNLAQMIVPAVATKLVCSIERLDTSARRLTCEAERTQTLHQFITNSKSLTPLTLETLTKDILNGLYHYHVRGIAYKHLHPDNILVINGHAALKPIYKQQECKIGEDWPFEGVEVANEDLGKPGDLFNFGLLILWMACKGDDDYYGATMKFYCNVALIKMIMADDPSQRPEVDSMLCYSGLIFSSNDKWGSMTLQDYLKKVFGDKCTAKAEESFDQPSQSEIGESISESENMILLLTEEESGNETTESGASPSKPSSLASTEVEGKETSPPSKPAEA